MISILGNPLAGATRHEKALIINCGSSSVKYACFDSSDPRRVLRGRVERLRGPDTRLLHRSGTQEILQQLPSGGYEQALHAILQLLAGAEPAQATHTSSPTFIAHRVVHGGEQFSAPAVVDDAVLARLEFLNNLAPLHNPANVAGIIAARRVFPGIPHVAVFDTAFHQTLPPHAYLYALPYELYQNHHVRRYGFHGASHAYAALAGARTLGRSAEHLRIITCHLGAGASVCAVNQGCSVDTSMGFTPSEGLVMSTRCGDLDPAVVPFLQRITGMNYEEVEKLLNHHSGVAGLTGLGGDMIEIERQAELGHPRARLALAIYAYRLKKYLGAYAAVMGGVDLVVFTGGVGQGSPWIREQALQGLEFLGIELDTARNRHARGHDEICRITSAAARVPVLIVPADEEWMLAREALRALNQA